MYHKKKTSKQNGNKTYMYKNVVQRGVNSVDNDKHTSSCCDVNSYMYACITERETMLRVNSI